MNFQKIVLIIAIILLIVSLIFIGISLSKSKSDEAWPPLIGDCPDYWVDLSGNGAMCVNEKALGKCNLPSEGSKNPMDFSKAPFTGDNGLCSKYMWANNCGLSWDGITYGVSNPCAKTTSTTTTSS